MQWTVAAPFIRDEASQWLAPYVTDNHHLKIVPRIGEPVSWHEKRVPVTGPMEWVHFARQGKRALSQTTGGVITVFPQLASIVGAEKQLLRRRDTPILSWFFNTAVESSVRMAPARLALRSVDRFVVHSSNEIQAYAQALHLDPARFTFVPLQYGGDVDQSPEEAEEPFVFATGSGHRDYGTFFEAIARLGYPTKVLASDHALAGTNPPKNVEILEQITKPEIRKLIRRARVNVVPMNTVGLTAGLVTIVEAFSHERALVATTRPGIEDYLLDGENSMLSAYQDSEGLATSLEAMWTDHHLRSTLNQGAARYAKEHCTDEAAGRELSVLLDALEATGD